MAREPVIPKRGAKQDLRSSAGVWGDDDQGRGLEPCKVQQSRGVI